MVLVWWFWQCCLLILVQFWCFCLELQVFILMVFFLCKYLVVFGSWRKCCWGWFFLILFVYLKCQRVKIFLCFVNWGSFGKYFLWIKAGDWCQILRILFMLKVNLVWWVWCFILILVIQLQWNNKKFIFFIVLSLILL